MNKKLKIAIYSGSIPSTTFIENLIKGISSKHEVLLFGKQKKKVHYTDKNICCYPTYSNRIPNFIATKWHTFLLLIRYPKRFKVLWQQIKTKKGWYAKYNWWTRYAPVLLHLPTIFHIQWAKDLKYWIFLKEKLGVKMVLSLRGAHINYSPLANNKLAESYRINFPKIDAFHAVSKAIAEESEKYGAVPEKIKVIHSIIPKSTFDLFKVPKEQDEVLNIISVGRHHWKKGYTTALDACRILKDNNISFSYTIIADGKLPEELIYQRHQLELLKEVTFIKGMNQQELFKKMQQADVLLLPSLEEGIANVVLEAMAIGLPVISTDCGGMKEVVIHGKTGWLVPVLDSKAMAEVLIDVNQTSIVKLNKTTQNAYNLVQNKFNHTNSIKEFYSFYCL